MVDNGNAELNLHTGRNVEWASAVPAAVSHFARLDLALWDPVTEGEFVSEKIVIEVDLSGLTTRVADESFTRAGRGEKRSFRGHETILREGTIGVDVMSCVFWDVVSGVPCVVEVSPVGQVRLVGWDDEEFGRTSVKGNRADEAQRGVDRCVRALYMTYG